MTAGYAQQISDCTEAFISEYMEGTGKNRALEIYNPTVDTIDMSKYSIKVYASGPTNQNVMPLTGLLPPKCVMVCGHPQCNQATAALCCCFSDQLKFNGDDAVGLYKNDTLIDIIGEIGVNPGNTGWQVGAGFTKNNTLRRGFDVKQPSPYWSINQLQWDVYPMDSIGGLGDNNNLCAAAATVEFVTTSSSANEGAGTAPIQINVANPTSGAASVIICVEEIDICVDPPALAECDALGNQTADYTLTTFGITNDCPGTAVSCTGNMPALPFTEPIPSGFSGNFFFTVNLIDDVINEGDEHICFSLSIGSGNIVIGNKDKHLFIIVDNDGVGLNEQALAGVSIFPTVVSEEVFISGLSNSESVQIVLYDMMGNSLLPNWNYTTHQNITMNLVGLPAGMYVLQLGTENGMRSEKIIKL